MTNGSGAMVRKTRLTKIPNVLVLACNLIQAVYVRGENIVRNPKPAN